MIVLTWNGREDTLACLRSLAAVPQPALRVFVVDNASTDGTAEAVRAAHPDVAVIHAGANLGFAGGNNLGIRAALAEGAAYVLLLNNDATVEPGTIAALLAALQAEPDAGAVCPLVTFADPPDLVWFAGADFDPARGRSGRVRGYRRRLGPWLGELPRETDRGVGAALLVERAALEQVGLLDDGLFFLFEDVDWSLRLRAAGRQVAFTPDAVVRHRVAASQGGSEVTPTTAYYLTRNHLVVCARHAPKAPLAAARRSAVVVAVHAREALRSASPATALRAVLRGWRDFRTGRMGAV